MRTPFGYFGLWLVVIAVVFGGGTAARAQTDLFAPRVYVNDSVVTGFEMEQRIAFLSLLRAPGDIPALAEKLLIEDKLRLQAAQVQGITLTDDQLKGGMEEFAARANLTLDEFLAAIQQGGVAPESFRDFVRAGLVWREVVRAKFGPSVRVTNADIDRALESYQRPDDSDRLLLSELVLPLGGETDARNRLLARRLSETLNSRAGFTDAARKYSTAPTRARGGQLDWTSVDALPPVVASAVRGLEPGQVSGPVPVTAGAVALFFLHEREAGGGIDGAPGSVEFAQFLIPGAGSAAASAEAARIIARAQSCDDLYPLARGLPPDRLSRQTMAQSSVPGDIAAELARLDAGEASAALRRGSLQVVLMLCGRNGQTGNTDSTPREALRGGIVNQRLSSLSDVYLEELRQAAIIRTP